jgi:hypothetical protein
LIPEALQTKCGGGLAQPPETSGLLCGKRLSRLDVLHVLFAVGNLRLDKYVRGHMESSVVKGNSWQPNQSVATDAGGAFWF